MSSGAEAPIAMSPPSTRASLKGGIRPPFKLALVLGGLIAIGASAPLLIVAPFSLRSGTQFVARARDGAAASAGSYRRPLGNDPETLDPARISDTYGRSV